ncbi:exported protein of unknown function [Cupriavidus taiwanensis]|nr:exported protein of unknown function [Cupriavidus taiwanensis]
MVGRLRRTVLVSHGASPSGACCGAQGAVAGTLTPPQQLVKRVLLLFVIDLFDIGEDHGLPRRQNRLHRKLGFPTLTKTFLLAEIDNICGQLRTDAAGGPRARGTTPDTPNEEQSNVPPRPRAGG